VDGASNIAHFKAFCEACGFFLFSDFDDLYDDDDLQ
jgi:hypothetical protein